MAETLNIPTGIPKAEKYKILLPQIAALIGGEEDLIANLANISAALKSTFGYFWVGFYVVKGNDLVLGPFQGAIACTRIGYGKGVCGIAWQERKTIRVPNVEDFPGHISCNPGSRSEIVVPGLKDGRVFIVLDIDSERLDEFDASDQLFLEEIMRKIEGLF